MRAITGELHSADCLQVFPYAQSVDMWLPVVNAVMFCSGGKFDVFSNMTDDSVVGIAVVVAARCGMRVEVAADPAAGINCALQDPGDVKSLAPSHFNSPLNEIMFGPSRDTHCVFAWWNLLGKLPIVG